MNALQIGGHISWGLAGNLDLLEFMSRADVIVILDVISFFAKT